jgi:hypothetical protein
VTVDMSKPSPEMVMWDLSFPCSRNQVGCFPLGLAFVAGCFGVTGGACGVRSRTLGEDMAAGHHLLGRSVFKVHILLFAD